MMKTGRALNRCGGFRLIELLVVIAIAVIPSAKEQTRSRFYRLRVKLNYP